MGFFQRVIQPHFDQNYFTQIDETVAAVFASAEFRARTEGRVLESQLAHARGSERYFALQRTIMDVSVDLGAEELTARAGNFPMPVARHKRFLIATCITDSLKRLQGSKARKLLASLNAVLEPHQQDLFDPSEPSFGDTYFGLIVVAKRLDGDQRQPAGVYFGVPSSTLRSWHFYERLDNIIAMYEEPAAPKERLTKPRLRKVPRSVATKLNLKPKRGP